MLFQGQHFRRSSRLIHAHGSDFLHNCFAGIQKGNSISNPWDEPQELGTHLPEVSSKPPKTNADPQENGAEQGEKVAAGEVGHGEKPSPNPCSDTIFPGILELFLSRVWKCHGSRGEREAPPGSSGGAGSGKAPEFRPEEEPCQHHLLQRGLPRICSFAHNQGEKQTVKARLYPIFSSRLSHRIAIFSQ